MEGYRRKFLIVKEVVRPGGFELPTFWFVGAESKKLNALFAIASGYRRYKI
jgi:hypothetical protein